jgi:hypothetical protein
MGCVRGALHFGTTLMHVRAYNEMKRACLTILSRKKNNELGHYTHKNQRIRKKGGRHISHQSYPISCEISSGGYLV